jgi:type I restriction enzyme S subunit
VRFAYGESLAAEDRNEGQVPVFGSNGIVGTHDHAITLSPAIVIGRKGSSGRITWSDSPCFPIDTTYFVDRSQTRENMRWLFYALEFLELDKINFDSAVPGLSRELAYSLRLAFPTKPEQQRIAACLDSTCAAIDAAVAAKRRQIETLNALRSTIIQESVTKSIDPSVEMIDSDIDWLPEIPKHWGKARLKRHVRMIRGQFAHRPRSDPAFYDGPYPFIQTGSISAVDKFITEFTQTLNEDGLRISKLFPANTIVMTITGAKIAEVAVTTFEACFPDSIIGFVPDHCVNRDYLYYLLVAMKPALLRAMVVTTQPNINYVQIGGNYIPLPPVREQELIAEHIERRVHGVKEVQESLNKQIETLTAYRKSLIHECVTGQRRVTEEDLRQAAGAGSTCLVRQSS